PSGRMGGCPGGPRGRGVAPGRGLLPVAASLPPGLPEGPRGLPASLPRVCRLPPGAVRTVPVRAEGRRRQRFPGVLRALLRPRGRGGPPGQVAERLPHGPERPRRGAVSLAPAALPPLGAAPDRGLPGEGRLVPAPGRQTPARGPQPRGLRAPGRRARVVETPSGRGSRAGPRRGRRARAAARRGEG
ncbi:unnamed protein product, partial [Prorocentrum cordatum]